MHILNYTCVSCPQHEQKSKCVDIVFLTATPFPLLAVHALRVVMALQRDLNFTAAVNLSDRWKEKKTSSRVSCVQGQLTSVTAVMLPWDKLFMCESSKFSARRTEKTALESRRTGRGTRTLVDFLLQ